MESILYPGVNILRKRFTFYLRVVVKFEGGIYGLNCLGDKFLGELLLGWEWKECVIL